MATSIKMVRLSKGMSEGTVETWLKREGDQVVMDESIFVVMTDKTTVEVPAQASGTLLRILVKEGATAEVGATLGYIGAPGDELPSDEQPKPQPDKPTVVELQQSSTTQASTRQRAAPKAQRLAKEHGIDLSQISGTGPEGLILERDVLRIVEGSTTETSLEEQIPLTGRRKLMAERMALSKRTAAHATTVAEVDMTDVNRNRNEHSATYTAFIARAVVTAIGEFPLLNSTLEGDYITLKKYVNLGVAVDTEDGLVVVVIRDAGEKALPELNDEIGQLADKARSGKLMPEDVSDSTFTITNSGVLGSLFFTPIINPPQAATLGIGKVMESPVVKDGKITARPMMYLCLSYDHRFVDGAVAVRFLQRVKAALEEVKGIDPMEPS